LKAAGEATSDLETINFLLRKNVVREQSELKPNLSDLYEFQEFYSLKIVVTVINRIPGRFIRLTDFPYHKYSSCKYGSDINLDLPTF